MVIYDARPDKFGRGISPIIDPPNCLSGEGEKLTSFERGSHAREFNTPLMQWGVICMFVGVIMSSRLLFGARDQLDSHTQYYAPFLSGYSRR